MKKRQRKKNYKNRFKRAGLYCSYWFGCLMEAMVRHAFSPEQMAIEEADDAKSFWDTIKQLMESRNEV